MLNFKMAIYVACSRCGGTGLVKGAFVSFVSCKERRCRDGQITVLVDRNEMNALLCGTHVLEVSGEGFMVTPKPPIYAHVDPACPPMPGGFGR